MADRRFGWLQFDATDEMKRLLQAYKSLINPDDLVEDEDDPHVPVLYGISTVDPQVIRDAVGGQWPAPWELGRLSVFRNRKSHVLKVEVTGDRLFLLNRNIKKVVKVKDTFDYRPHLTVAHLRPGQADQYVSLGGTWSEGLKAPGDVLVFHSKDRQRYEVPL